jgi:hypothetical protein
VNLLLALAAGGLIALTIAELCCALLSSPLPLRRPAGKGGAA